MWAAWRRCLSLTIMEAAPSEPTSPDRWDWLRDEIRSAQAAFSAQLTDHVATTNQRVPGLEWTVAELSQHIACLPKLYTDLNTLADGFETPNDWAKLSRDARAHITETKATALATLIETQTEALLTELGHFPDEPRWVWGRKTTAATVASGYLGELIVHGMDLGRLTKVKVTLNKEQALAIIDNQMALAPAFTDPEKLRKCEGIFHVKIRGGRDFTFLVGDGELRVNHGKPNRADAHMAADPVTWVLVGLGRMNQFKAGLTGKVLAYGRKPWLLLALGNATADGV